MRFAGVSTRIEWQSADSPWAVRWLLASRARARCRARRLAVRCGFAASRRSRQRQACRLSRVVWARASRCPTSPRARAVGSHRRGRE
ncbi:hypothetical protein NFJ02_11g05470 [Pycnococcus provasolii]